MSHRAEREVAVVGYPLHPIPALLSGYDVGPLLKKGGIYHGKPGFPKKHPGKSGYLE